MTAPASVNYVRVIDGNGTTRQWWDDATRTYHEYDVAAVETLARAYTATENGHADDRAIAKTAATNETDLRTKAKAAIQKNLDYLALASPANADNLAQLRLLTREATALIRLMIRELADTSGT